MPIRLKAGDSAAGSGAFAAAAGLASFRQRSRFDGEPRRLGNPPIAAAWRSFRASLLASWGPFTPNPVVLGQTLAIDTGNRDIDEIIKEGRRQAPRVACEPTRFIPYGISQRERRRGAPAVFTAAFRSPRDQLGRPSRRYEKVLASCGTTGTPDITNTLPDARSGTDDALVCVATSPVAVAHSFHRGA